VSLVPDAEQRLWRTVVRRMSQVTRNRVQLKTQAGGREIEHGAFILTRTVDDIVASIARYCQRISQRRH